VRDGLEAPRRRQVEIQKSELSNEVIVMNAAPEALEVNDPGLLRLVDRSAVVERVCTGFQFSEGPIWNPKEQALYFSDMPMDIRRRWSEKDGVVEVRNPSNKCNGMTYDARGNLYICEHVTSSLVMETPSGERKVLATHWHDKELNSPNDVVVRSDGSVYFSDPTYGRKPVFGLERKQDLDFQGVYRLSPGGTLHREAHDFVQPNGLCFSPDEKILYVNDTERAHIRAFDVSPDGALSDSRVFASRIGVVDYGDGVVDGMKCDEHGNVYVTGPRGIWVFDPGGTHLGVIVVPEVSGNLNWGGSDWRDLYCACSTSIYRVRMEVKGNPVAYMKMA
jgi:gluconolactonase